MDNSNENTNATTNGSTSISIPIPASTMLSNNDIFDLVGAITISLNDKTIKKVERNKQVSHLLTELATYTEPLIHQIYDLDADKQTLILCRLARLHPELIQKELESIRNSKLSLPTLHELSDAVPAEAEESPIIPVPAETRRAINKAKQVGGLVGSVAEIEKILKRLGYENISELYQSSKASQIFGEYINPAQQQTLAEKATSCKVEHMLKKWKAVQEIEDEFESVTSNINNDNNTNNNSDNNYNSSPSNNRRKSSRTAGNKAMKIMGVEQIAHKDDAKIIIGASSKAHQLL